MLHNYFIDAATIIAVALNSFAPDEACNAADITTMTQAHLNAIV